MSKYLDPKLHELWNYYPKTGVFTSKIETHGRAGPIHVGDVVGSLKDGYIQLAHHGKTYRAHILAWVWQTGSLPPEGYELDHRNTIRSDNRFDNLRLLTRGGNNLNPSGIRSDNTSGVRGVHKTDDRWFARITVKGEIIHLGTYDSFEDAVKARANAEARYWRGEDIDPIYVPKDQYEEKRIEAVRRSWSDPKLRAEQSATLKEYLSDPEAYKKRVEQLDKIQQAGSDAAKKAVVGSIWITNGIINRRLPSNQELPEGFHAGRSKRNPME